MALAEPLFTSQLYRENANVDTYMRLHPPALPYPPPFPPPVTSLWPTTDLSNCTWLSRSPSPSLPEISSINFSPLKCRLIGHDCIFPLRLCGRSIRTAASISCHTFATDRWSSRESWIFEFKVRKDREGRNLYRILKYVSNRLRI